jgi:hypothetical protein
MVAVPLMLVLSAAYVLAGPILVLSRDPRGAEVRAAATRFWTAVGDADDEAAHSMFSGSAAERNLLDAHLAWVHAAAPLVQRLQARFGDHPEAAALDAEKVFRLRAAQVQQRCVVISGDDAQLAGGSAMDAGLVLHRAGDGSWRVLAMSRSPRDRAATQHLLITMAEMSRNVAGELDGVAADKLRWEDISKRVEEVARPAFDEWARSLVPRATPEPTDDVDPPGSSEIADIPDGEVLVRTLGKSIDSEDAAKLIGSLPGLPGISESSRGAFISSRAAGIGLNFNGQGITLRSVFLYAQGREGYRGFPAKLPRALSFDDRRIDVECKIGRAPWSGGGGVIGYWAQYPTLGLSVEYWGSDLHDPFNRIADIFVTAPEPDADPPEEARTPVRRPRLEFRLVADPATPESRSTEVMPDPEASPVNGAAMPDIPVIRQTLLDETHVLNVSLMPTLKDGDLPRISLYFSPEGTRRIVHISEEHQGQRLAIVFDGRILAAPMMRGKLAEYVVIEAGRNGRDPGGDAKRLCGRLHAAVSVLPATAPSTAPSSP